MHDDTKLNREYLKVFHPALLSRARMRKKQKAFDRAVRKFARDKEGHLSAVHNFQDFLKKVSPRDLYWCIINNWGAVDSRPFSIGEFIELLIEVRDREFRTQLLGHFRDLCGDGDDELNPDSDLATWIRLLSDESV